VVLSDAPIPPDSTEALDQQNYWGINITQVETALSHLLGEGQEVSRTARQDSVLSCFAKGQAAIAFEGWAFLAPLLRGWGVWVGWGRKGGGGHSLVWDLG
jgi:hypothetical protein